MGSGECRASAEWRTWKENFACAAARDHLQAVFPWKKKAMAECAAGACCDGGRDCGNYVCLWARIMSKLTVIKPVISRTQLLDNELDRNNIWVAGVYPYGFHIVIYYLHMVFGIKTYVLLRIFGVVQTYFVYLAMVVAG